MTNKDRKTMFTVQPNQKEIIQLPTDHVEWVPSMNVCLTRHIASQNEVEETYYRCK